MGGLVFAAKSSVPHLDLDLWQEPWGRFGMGIIELFLALQS